MDVEGKVRTLRKVSEEQLQGSEAASQVKLDLEGSEVFAEAEQQSYFCLRAKVEGGLRVAYVRHGDIEGLGMGCG